MVYQFIITGKANIIKLGDISAGGDMHNGLFDAEFAANINVIHQPAKDIFGSGAFFPHGVDAVKGCVQIIQLQAGSQHQYGVLNHNIFGVSAGKGGLKAGSFYKCNVLLYFFGVLSVDANAKLSHF